MPHDESPESHNESSGYNQIFEKLVVNYDEDSVERLIGMLAYAEYKLDLSTGQKLEKLTGVGFH